MKGGTNGDGKPPPGPANENDSDPGGNAVAAAAMRHILRARQELRRLLSGGLVTDPCFDLLLDLYVQEQSGRAVPATSVYAATAVPAATAHRWVDVLENAGLIERIDAAAGQETSFSLTHAARMTMTNWTTAMGWNRFPTGSRAD